MEAHYNADSTAITGATWYSLGKFVSNQRERRKDGGMAAEITITASDPSVSYDLAYRLFWVRTSWRDGVRRYEVLPSSVADTLLAARPADTILHVASRPADPAFPQYERFMQDTRTLLSPGDTVFTELK
jgi:poly-gamma-glutamate synthesis protein (capsule biosynthesis protein)